jgi:hypothetical protein
MEGFEEEDDQGTGHKGEDERKNEKEGREMKQKGKKNER